MIDTKLEPIFARPSGFRWNEVSAQTKPEPISPLDPVLGPLADFAGTFQGNGFNTIFRPNNTVTPTPLPTPVGGDNILELNLTSETLSFSKALGNIPNRGLRQGDIFLNGIPYVQTINDVTVPAQPVGIHFEPGVWLVVPQTSVPAEGPTVARMASIPHGTTIVAQGTTTSITGKPTIPPVDITPSLAAPPNPKIRFNSQTAANNPPSNPTARIPQDLTSFIAAGTITQAILDDPNTLLRNVIASQNIISTTIVQISTSPQQPLFGGGTDNIAFLLGDPAGSAPNANDVQLNATFWIEVVEHIVPIPPFRVGQPPLTVTPEPSAAGHAVPKFLVQPPVDIPNPRVIRFRTVQIQYSQTVFLVFNGLSWPHVSVATLVPSDPVPVPPVGWESVAGGPASISVARPEAGPGVSTRSSA